MSNDIKSSKSTPVKKKANIVGKKKPERTGTNTPEKRDILSLLNNLFTESIEDNEGMLQGLKNLNSLAPYDEITPLKGKELTDGVMGFRKSGNNIELAIACGKAQVRYITLSKFIALVENLHDPESATIMIQNFKEQGDYNNSRGQILARINAESSAITVIQGVTGRIIRGPQDFALFDVYYIDRKDLTSFYMAAKTQISNRGALETMIQTYDGWKAFEVPLDPLNPYNY